MEKEPKILSVDQYDNAAVVEFASESEPGVYPAELLHAAKEIGAIMMEKHEDEEKHKP